MNIKEMNKLIRITKGIEIFVWVKSFNRYIKISRKTYEYLIKGEELIYDIPTNYYETQKRLYID